MTFYLWQRYFLKELAKSFIAILASFYALYVIIDYANHLGTWRQHGVSISWQQGVVYYLYEFIHRADVLLPFILLVATLKTLLSLNKHGELVALLCSGVSLKTLLHPFIYCAIALTLLLYANTEFGIPYALNQLKLIQGSKKKDVSISHTVQEAKTLDGSHLLYSSYHADNHVLEDVFWIHSNALIFRMQKLWIHEQPPRGAFVETLQRDANGLFNLIDSSEGKIFPNMVLAEKQCLLNATAPERQSLSTLWCQLYYSTTSYTYREAHIATVFYQRIVSPWLCLLALIIAAPYCMYHSRHTSAFAIYALAIFGLVASYLLLDAIVILGRRQIVDPGWAIVTPLTAVSICAFYNYYRLR